MILWGGQLRKLFKDEVDDVSTKARQLVFGNFITCAGNHYLISLINLHRHYHTQELLQLKKQEQDLTAKVIGKLSEQHERLLQGKERRKDLVHHPLS